MLYHIVSCCISSPACSAESIDFLRRYSADLHTSAYPRIAMSPTGPRSRLLISSRYVKPAKPIAPPVAAHHRFTGFNGLTGPYRTHWQCERFRKNQKPEVLTADNASTTACGCSRHQPNSGTHRDGQTEGEDRWHLTSRHQDSNWALPHSWRNAGFLCMTQPWKRWPVEFRYRGSNSENGIMFVWPHTPYQPSPAHAHL